MYNFSTDYSLSSMQAVVELVHWLSTEKSNMSTYNIDEVTYNSSTMPSFPATPGYTGSFRCNEGLPLFRFVMDVVISLPISIFGIIGNVLAFVVLCHQRQSVSTNLLLQSLAILDTILLLLCILMRSMRYIYECTPAIPYFKAVLPYTFLVFYPSLYAIRMSCTWLTALLTIDRWIAVCRPLHAQRLVTRKVAAVQVLCTILGALLFNIPRFFEYVISPYKRYRNTKAYMFGYVVSFSLVLLYIIPMAILVVFNFKLIRALKYSEKDRAVLTPSANNSPHKSVTMVVLAVTTTFLVCNSFPLISHVIFSITITFPETKTWLLLPSRILSNISNVMVVINSAINFVIYCVCSRNFRLTFMEMFFCKKRVLRAPVKRTASSRFTLTYLSLTRTRSSTSSDKYKQPEQKDHLVSHPQKHLNNHLEKSKKTNQKDHLFS